MRWMCDHPELIAGRTVVDVGCGNGLGAIAALRLGAEHAVANDIDHLALAAAAVNAALNGVRVDWEKEAGGTGGAAGLGPRLTLSSANLLEDDVAARFRPEGGLVVLLGDMLYDDEIAAAALAFGRRHLGTSSEGGAAVMFGDPGRQGRRLLRAGEAEEVVRMPLPAETCIENYGMTEARAFRLLKAG